MDTSGGLKESEEAESGMRLREIIWSPELRVAYRVRRRSNWNRVEKNSSPFAVFSIARFGNGAVIVWHLVSMF